LKLRGYSPLRFGVVLGIGALVASVLCVQCIRTYFYTDAVLIPQQAEREAERQISVLATAAHGAGIVDPQALTPVIQHVLETAADRLLWIRVLNPDSTVLAQGGSPLGTATVPSGLWETVHAHESHGSLVGTPEGKALVVMLPFRLPHPPHISSEAEHRPVTYWIQIAVSLKSVARSLEGLRQNLVVGVAASIALLLSLSVIGIRAPGYLRGRYLEGELQLARRVQNDLQPKPHSATPFLDFAATAIPADHVGGDFHDIFETEPGKIGIVLGDVSGKGVPAALLVSVLHGAIRSSTPSAHQHACARINRMLCERTACERFATLFWGIFDPATSTLRYVNAGHTAPMLFRQGSPCRIVRLDEGGPVLGMLPNALYSAGEIEIASSDMLILYSDGIDEATNHRDEEFGESRLQNIVSANRDAAPADLCGRIINQVAAFATAGAPPDDRTLLVVRFPSQSKCEAVEPATAA
jgi:Stage II sporulation protein E (SpoIIE)